MKLKTNVDLKDVWNFSRIISSSRIMNIIILPVIFLSLFFDLAKKNKLIFLLIAVILLLYLWINIIFVIFRTFDPTFTKGIKLRKIILLLFASILIYSFVYYAFDNYFNDSFYESNEYKKNKETENSFEKYFEMVFYTTNIMATLGYTYDLSPKRKIIKSIVILQSLTSIILLLILISRIV